MAIVGRWWKFTHRMIEYEKDDPGVYELSDKNGAVLYIGSSIQVKKRLQQHFQEVQDSCVRQNAVQYRVEYGADYERREREAYAEHLAAHGHPPLCCTREAPSQT